MTLTIPEIKDRLKQLDEVTLLEILSITSEDIVERFEDLVEDRADILTKQVDWD